MPFVPLTLETVIDAIRDCGATELATAPWARYADFDRVARVVMDEIDALAPDHAMPTVQVSKPLNMIAAPAVQSRPKPSPRCS